ncbi:MAG: hypothetical protein AAF620_00750 [Bacteroidota bacterium]
MAYRINTSTNIIRDGDSQMDYIVTPNAENIVGLIEENVKRGQKAFNLVGSFGTGKSSFLLAFTKVLLKEEQYFKTKLNGKAKVFKLVGEYRSLIDSLCEEFQVENDYASHQKLFDAIYQEYEEVKNDNGTLFIFLDEFGKYLEYGVQNNTSKEVYFLQQLAEFVNAENRNIVLITSIHQNILSYSNMLSKQERDEWKKVQGRFYDLPFNEPIDQLLFLVARLSDSEQSNQEQTKSLVKAHSLFQSTSLLAQDIEASLYPLSFISAYSLASALQRYGQNERSLFTFLNSIFFTEYKKKDKRFELEELYDYLFQDFYTYLVEKNNPDFNRWSAIKIALERSENIVDINREASNAIIKSLGLLTIFSRAGASLNTKLFSGYLNYRFAKQDVKDTLKKLEKNQIIRYSKFDDSFKLFEGTDLDIERAISEAENRIDEIDVLKKLNSHFDFPISIAKAETYRKGTPRLFEFRLSNYPIEETPVGQIDGYINLIFSEKAVSKKKMEESTASNRPILYGYFNNTSEIAATLREIEKTEEVLRNIQDTNDRVAIRELNIIKRSNRNLLEHYVMDSLYSSKVSWFHNGNLVDVNSSQEFNQVLSRIAHETYPNTPVLHNELINRHKVSGTISASRRNLWNALVNHFEEEDLGFSKDKWPAEKTIYYSFLKNTGIHRFGTTKWELGKPSREDFHPLWEESLGFLDDCQAQRTGVLEFQRRLSRAPVKLKQGVIDFWIPTFLFVKRGDFALYNENGFVPYIDENILYMITRNPKEFYIKSFVLNDLRLRLFNKYRDFLNQGSLSTLDKESFIESIRPLLIFYKNLNQYSQTTKTISARAIRIREAIAKAVDPEETFFEKLPAALGYSLSELSSNDKLFEDYIIDFQNHIEEIKSAFDNLLNRIELFICDEIIGRKVDFGKYTLLLKKRYIGIKEHHLKAYQKSLYWRVTTDFNDRNSFLMALAQAVLNKSLERINDTDEQILKTELKRSLEELDNLVELSKREIDENDELIKLRFSTFENGDSEKTVRITKKQRNEIDGISSEIDGLLNKNKKLKLHILVSLLNKEINKE